MSAPNASCIRVLGLEKCCCCHVCSPSESVFLSTTPAPCWRRFLVGNPDFTRMPKYGIERKSQTWRSCKHRALKSTLPIAELAFGIYFSYFVWFAVSNGQFLSVPFLLMFQGGFLYVALLSLLPWSPIVNF